MIKIRVRRKGGFTLLEMLTVVIIIAILTSIALPQFMRASERVRAAEAIQILGQIRGSQHRHKAMSLANDYTNDVTALDVDLPQDKTGAPITNIWDWTPAILNSNMSVSHTAPFFATGYVAVPRNSGQYKGELLGIQFGTGTLCGDFTPYGGTIIACGED